MTIQKSNWKMLLLFFLILQMGDENMNYYTYSGPVIGMTQIMTNKWEGETYANTDKKAVSNLTYQFKKECGLLPSSKISLINKPIKS